MKKISSLFLFGIISLGIIAIGLALYLNSSTFLNLSQPTSISEEETEEIDDFSPQQMYEKPSVTSEENFYSK
ncbi:MAG: hypothetical protein IPN70_01205 [Candidatus Moraniibacteriota bacterium]|nr:MAG: hypothetical protein IPN70_01205 [Candidatus Moranbacteria bacterium]